jgi:hypothetical protein
LAKIDSTDYNTEWVTAGGSAVWGGITGTVTDQTDLVTYVTGLGYLTDAPSDGSQYARQNGAWAVVTGGGGGGVAWGAITGTLSDQTDLQNALNAKLSAKTVYEVTSNAYTLASTDANNIVYIPGSASGGFPPINITVPDDATYSFPIGTVITLSVDNSVSGSDIYLIQGDPMAPAPIIIGTTYISSSTSGNFLLTKVAANRWICS